jgi:ABC-type lipoprotein release transport system permease subunit
MTEGGVFSRAARHPDTIGETTDNATYCSPFTIIATAFALTRFMASFLFGVRPWDPVAFLSAPLILSMVALVAVWLPATRASKVDPMRA